MRILYGKEIRKYETLVVVYSIKLLQYYYNFVVHVKCTLKKTRALMNGIYNKNIHCERSRR